jgi:hypothetical protein
VTRTPDGRWFRREREGRHFEEPKYERFDSLMVLVKDLQVDGFNLPQELLKMVGESSRYVGVAAAAVDALGMNYQGSRPPTPQYPPFHQSFPDKFIYRSETASTIATPGEYPLPVPPFPRAPPIQVTPRLASVSYSAGTPSRGMPGI